MLLRADTGQVFALTGLGGGQSAFVEQIQYIDVPDPVEAPPNPAQLLPTGSFGKVWSLFESIRMNLGWATQPAQNYDASIDPTADVNVLRFSVPNGNAVDINFQNGMWSVASGDLQTSCADPTTLLQTLSAPTGSG